jgi:hypothetical protein
MSPWFHETAIDLSPDERLATIGIPGVGVQIGKLERVV